VLRVLEHRAARPDLDDLAQVHHRHAVADALDHRHVVRDEQEGDAELGLQVEQQVDDLRRIDTSSADTASSAMTTLGCSARARAMRCAGAGRRELVRVAVRGLGRQAHLCSSHCTRCWASSRVARPCTSSGSMTDSPPSGAGRARRTGPGR
jgi:hypothetical protein